MTQQPILPHYKSPYTEFMKEEYILHANENAKQDAHGNILHRPNIIMEKLMGQQTFRQDYNSSSRHFIRVAC